MGGVSTWMGDHLQTEAIVPIFIQIQLLFLSTTILFSLYQNLSECICKKLYYPRRMVAVHVDWAGDATAQGSFIACT